MKISDANRLRILYFLVFSCTASWLPIFAEYLKDRGLTGIKIGIILSVTPLMMFLVQPFYGILADRFGYKKCLLISSLFASLSFALYLSQGGFGWLFTITVCMSLFYNSLQPLLDSFSLRLAQNNPVFSYGTLRIAGAAGWVFTGIPVGYFIDTINTTIIFVFSATSLFLTFLFSFSLKSDKEKITARENSQFKNLKQVFGNKILIFLLICIFLISACATTIWNYYSIYMKENGASASLVGIGISFQGLCELPLFYFSAKIIRKFGIRTTLLITVFATAIRMLLYSVVKNPQAAIPIELLHGVSWSLFWVVCVEYVNKLVREDWRVTGQSLLYAAYFGLGAIVGNFWTGYLYDAKLLVSEIFLINAGLVGIVGLLIWIFMKKPTGEFTGTIN
jgi:PPP family 3-phenylpropionic acid transporter